MPRRLCVFLLCPAIGGITVFQSRKDLIQFRLHGAQHLILPGQSAQHRLQRFALNPAAALFDGMAVTADVGTGLRSLRSGEIALRCGGTLCCGGMGASSFHRHNLLIIIPVYGMMEESVPQTKTNCTRTMYRTVAEKMDSRLFPFHQCSPAATATHSSSGIPWEPPVKETLRRQ